MFWHRTPGNTQKRAEFSVLLAIVSFLLRDAGTLQGKQVKGEWFVISGSGTGEFEGLGGEGGFEAELGQHASIWLNYRFE